MMADEAVAGRCGPRSSEEWERPNQSCGPTGAVSRNDDLHKSGKKALKSVEA